MTSRPADDARFCAGRYVGSRDRRDGAFSTHRRALVLRGVDRPETSREIGGDRTALRSRLTSWTLRPAAVGGFVMHGPRRPRLSNEVVYVEIAESERLVNRHVSAPQFQMTVTFAG